jgi:hypothetical protein
MPKSRARRTVLIAVGLLLAFPIVAIVLSELAEVVVIHTVDASGEPAETRIWLVEDREGHWWIRGDHQSGWGQRARSHPEVTIQRGGQRQHFRAILVPSQREAVTALMREKYGLADWMIAAMRNEDTTIVFRLDPAGH